MKLISSSFRNSFVMYSKAMEFRTSHYFIMFMSESFALAIGFSPFSKYADLDCVTKPVRIEFPRSLIEVVVFWNIPMHNWLKTCKYCTNFNILCNIEVYVDLFFS